MRRKLAKWTPFERAVAVANPALPNVALAENCECFVNSRFVVLRYRIEQDKPGLPPLVLWLSVRNVDRSARHDWRDLQKIKNELAGAEWEAVEIYPAEARLVDTANQFHLWCFPPEWRFPFGFDERLVSDTGDEIGSVQRPFAEEHRPGDARYLTREEMTESYTRERGDAMLRQKT